MTPSEPLQQTACVYHFNIGIPLPQPIFPICSHKAGNENSLFPSFPCLIPQPRIYFPKLLTVERQLFLLCNGTQRGVALGSCLTIQGAERCERRGWVERCSASQAGGIALAAALPGFRSASPGREPFSHSRLLPCHTEGGREEKAEGSLHTHRTQRPGSHLRRASHEEESLCPYSHFAFDLKPSPASTRDNGGAIHFQTPPGSGLRSWGLSADHR